MKKQTIAKEIFNLLNQYPTIKNKCSHASICFLTQELTCLFSEHIPPKSQTQASVSGAWFESEYDEGFNACIEQIKRTLV